MERMRKAFGPGVEFRSDTDYVADKKEYHIYPGDAFPAGDPWYTLVTPADPPLLAAFRLRDLKNVTIDLSGAKLVFHGRILPFHMTNCRNVTLKNFSIDYERPFFTQGTVTDSGGEDLTLRIPESFRYRVERGELIAEGEGWEAGLSRGAPLFQSYDAETGRLSPKTPMMLAVTGEKVFPQENPPCPVYELLAESLPGRRVRFHGVPEFFRPDPGEIVAFTHENRQKPGFLLEDCRETVFEDIRLLHVSAMAMIANRCQDLVFRRFSCFLDGETGERIITVNADVLHGFHCTGRILAEDCRFENMLDDALNFHGNYTVTEAKEDARTFLTKARAAGLHAVPMYLPGDVINVYRGNTQERKASYTVSSAEYVKGSAYTQRIAVREPLLEFEEGDIVESTRMPELRIRRCVSAHARGGWRFSTGKSILMENCLLENSPIMFTGDTDYWFEDSPVRDVEIRENRFVYYPSSTPIVSFPVYEATEKAPYYHAGIRILRNDFEDCRRGILDMHGVDGILLEGNRFGEGSARSMRIEDCGNVRIL